MFIFFTFVAAASAQGLFGAQGANSLLGASGMGGYTLSGSFGSISPYGNQLGGGIGDQNIIGGGQTGGLLGNQELLGNQGLLGGLLGDQGLLGGLLGNQGLLGGIASPLTSTLNQLLGVSF